MFLLRILGLVVLLIPQAALSNYDPEKIKTTISNEQELFPISSWQQDAATASWVATSTQKWLSIRVGQNQTEIVSPYINAKQIAAAKARCLTVASSALDLESEDGRKRLMKLMHNATQHHRPKSIENNGTRFEVLPKVVGAFVKLFCKVKPAS